MATWTDSPLPEQWKRLAAETLVGREAALATLDDAWTAATDGARQVVLIGGDAGAGKSRLAAEVAVAVHRTGARVLIGGCVAELGRPYQPFVEPLTEIQASYRAGLLTDGADLPDGRPIIEWLRTVTASDLPPPDNHPIYARQMHRAVVAAINSAAGPLPLALILEDLHWSGPAGQQLFSFVVRNTADSRLLILATYRSEPPDRSPSLTDVLAGLQGLPGVRRIELPPLGVVDIARLLERDGGLPRQAAERTAVELRERTGGNPYFVRELWRDQQTCAGADTSGTPASVRDAFHSRLRRLRPDQRDIAGLAAVIGDEVELTILCQAGSQPAAKIVEAVDACVDAGVVSALNEGEGVVRFAHTLARQAVLDLMPASARLRGHADVAAAIERLPATRARVQRLAHHYASASALGFADQATRYLAEAAEAAAAGLAHRDAARLYERAAELMDEPRSRDAALLAAVRQHVYAGDFVRARELAEQVAETGDQAQRLEAAIAYEAASWRPGLPGYRAAQLLRQALDPAPPDPGNPDHIRATAVLGRALAFTAEPESASMHLRKAIDLARAAKDDCLLMEALSASLWERTGAAGQDATRQRAVELSDLAHAKGDLVLLGPAAHHRAMIGYFFGDPAQMEAGHRDLKDVARSTGQAYFDYFAGGVAYGRQFVRADFASANQSCLAQLKIGKTFGPNETTGPYGVQSFMIRRELGTLAEVRPMITGEEDPAAAWAPGLLALYTEFGMREPAARLLRWVLDHPLYSDDRTAQWPMVLAFCAEAVTVFEDKAAAARLRPAFAEYAGHNLVAQPFIALFGSADRYVGSLDSILGKGDPDASFAAALAMDTRMGASLHAAQTLVATVAHHRRKGRGHATVRRTVDQALAIAEPLNLRRVLPLLTNESTGSRPAGLTAREVEVLRLLGQGLGNREIGARLFISENTAANHVRSILLKTGAKNRTQAARYAADQGLLT